MVFVISVGAIILVLVAISYLRDIARAVCGKKDDEARGDVLYHYRVVFYWEQQGKSGFLAEHFWTYHNPTAATILDWTNTLKMKYDAAYIAIVNWRQIHSVRTGINDARNISYDIECDAINTYRNVNWRATQQKRDGK